MNEWILLAGYLVGVVPVALVAYPLAKREAMEAPDWAAAFIGFLWPCAALVLAFVAPFVLLARLVEAVWDR